jgi:hypothetical protein
LRFNPNCLAMGSGNAHALLHAVVGASTVVLRLELRCNGGACPSGGGSYHDPYALWAQPAVRSTVGELFGLNTA